MSRCPYCALSIRCFRSDFVAVKSKVGRTTALKPEMLEVIKTRTNRNRILHGEEIYAVLRMVIYENKLGLSCAKLSLASAKLHASLSSDQLKLATN